MRPLLLHASRTTADATIFSDVVDAYMASSSIKICEAFSYLCCMMEILLGLSSIFRRIWIIVDLFFNPFVQMAAVCVV
jgi:hypothetical protein